MSAIKLIYVDSGSQLEETTDALEQTSDIIVTPYSDPAKALEELGDSDCVVYGKDDVESEFLKKASSNGALETPIILYNTEKAVKPIYSQHITDYVPDHDPTELKERVMEVVEGPGTKLSRVIDGVGEAVAIVESGMEFVFVNKAFADRYGYETHEILGKEWNTLYPEEDSWINEESPPKLGDDDVWCGKTAAEKRDGSRFVERLRVSKAGEYYLCIASGHTDEGRDELERYKRIVETVSDGVYTLDANGHFTEVNEYVEMVTGYSRDELIGEHISIVMDEEDIRKGRETIMELLRDNDREVGVFEMDVHTVDGEIIPCENKIALLPSEEGFRGTVGVVRDITERKEKEKRLRHNLERLDKFANVVTHNLRNPLNIAHGSLQLARDEDGEEYLTHIEDALRRINEIIDNVLVLEQHGQIVSEPSELDIRDVTEDAWSRVVTKDADLVVEDGVVTAEETRLRTLLEKLIENSIEHAGGDVVVTVGTLEEGFYFEDDGPGIPDKLQNEVFELRYSTSEEGTGFGLSIVKSIVEAHDWDISVKEGSDGGVRFEVVPKKPKAESRKA